MFDKLNAIIKNNIFFVASIIFLSWFVASNNFSRMVGHTFPVVSPLEIEEVVPTQARGLAAIKIVGSSEKYFNCDFVDMEWSVETDGVSGTAYSYFLDAPQGRQKGKIEFTGIIVGMEKDQLEHATATVLHNCGMLEVISPWYGQEK